MAASVPIHVQQMAPWTRCRHRGMRVEDRKSLKCNTVQFSASREVPEDGAFIARMLGVQLACGDGVSAVAHDNVLSYYTLTSASGQVQSFPSCHLSELSNPN